ISFSYILMAVDPGEYTIGPATIVVDGDKLSSNTLQIEVVKGQSVPQANTTTPRGSAGQQDNRGEAQDISKDLFIRAVVDKTQAYTGEHLTVRYKLYTRVNLQVNDFDKLPDLNGFWSQDV